MTKGVYDHGLTPIRGFCLRATFLSKKIYIFQKFIFSLFTGLYITPTINLQITIVNWHHPSIRVIGNVGDSITELRKNNYN